MFKYFTEYFDYRTFLPVTLLLAIGLGSVYSATYDARVPEIFYRQLSWAAVSLAVALAVAFVPFRLLQTLAYPAYFLSVIMLVSVLLIGKTVSGSTSWFSVGTMRLQPAEFAKIATAMALAKYLARSDASLKQIKSLLVATGIVFLPLALIMLQPDMGTAIIFIGMFFPVLYWGGASRFTLVAFVATGTVALAALFGPTPFLIAVLTVGIVLYFTRENRIAMAVVFSLTVLVGISVQFIYNGLKPYQQKRIDTFLNPGADPLGAGYNIVQSKVAIGSGGMLGKGFLKGTQTQLNFIPEQWTDFIFCVPGEEFGFVGAATVLGLLTALLVRGIVIASSVKNPFSSFLAIALASTIASHVFVNIGMSLGLLPVVGVPLPFLSYGGSALLANMIMVGLVMNLHANRKEY
jgi:rod shape determining protein RodA